MLVRHTKAFVFGMWQLSPDGWLSTGPLTQKSGWLWTEKKQPTHHCSEQEQSTPVAAAPSARGSSSRSDSTVNLGLWAPSRSGFFTSIQNQTKQLFTNPPRTRWSTRQDQPACPQARLAVFISSPRLQKHKASRIPAPPQFPCAPGRASCDFPHCMVNRCHL